MISFDKLTFRQVEGDTVIKHFDCGDSDLNDFLLNDSKAYLDSMLAVTYVLEDNDADKTVAFYCLLNDKITIDPEEKNIWNRINRKIPNGKRYDAYPAVKIGRLGVSLDYAHQHIGQMMMMQIKMIFSRMTLSGCRFLTVDAYVQAIPFYEKCGFKFLTEKDKNDKTRAMYFDLMMYKK